MKITDIEFGKGKSYLDENGFVWEEENGRLYRLSRGVVIDEITNWYTLEQITSMNFEEQIDWHKVEVDTPILVSSLGEYWGRAHFAKYENGRVYVFINGGTSWTTNGTEFWDYAKLAKDGE